MDAIFASDGPRPMQCKKCGEAKLHDEFPSDGPSENCNHLPTWCLKCLKDNMTAGLFRIGYNCPECHAMARVSDVDMITHLLDSIICPVFHDLDKIQKMKQEAAVSMVPASGSVEVVLLDGQRCSLELRREMSLAEMKQKIASRLGVPASQQRLMHGGQELKPDTLEWKDAKVSYGSILQVVVVMYETGPGSMPGGGNVRALDFELTWIGKLKMLRNGKTAIDHLNGSCFVLNDRLDILASVDFMRRSWGSIMHHGPSNRHSPRSVQLQRRLWTLRGHSSHAVLHQSSCCLCRCRSTQGRRSQSAWTACPVLATSSSRSAPLLRAASRSRISRARRSNSGMLRPARCLQTTRLQGQCTTRRSFSVALSVISSVVLGVCSGSERQAPEMSSTLTSSSAP
mmetsp:Transcript_155536/g.497334  ORF Transcript_155536/g.497334 Transcript_155536/m.497334 type:complete len:398 (+) Transcript_155536:116-1309(+)